MDEKVKAIREANDRFRTTLIGGRVHLTHGVPWKMGPLPNDAVQLAE